MTDQLDVHDRPSDADMRRIADALVAGAPAAPAFPTTDDFRHDHDFMLEPPAPVKASRRGVWPLAVAAALVLLAGIALLGPWARSNQDVSTNTVASQPVDESEPPVPPFPTMEAGSDEPPSSSDDNTPPDDLQLPPFDEDEVPIPNPTATSVPQAAAAGFGTPLPSVEATQLTTPGRAEPGMFLVPGTASGNDLTAVFDSLDQIYAGRMLVDRNPVTGEEAPFPLLRTTPSGQPLLLRIVEGVPGDEYVRVQAPIRPHGQMVWVSTQNATFYQTDVRIEVDIAVGQLQVFRGDLVVFTSPIAWGKPDRPTALHDTYIEQILGTDGLGPEYGNSLLMMASYSEALENFRGGLPAQTIHGTNDPGRIGQPSTSGGIFLPNELMDELAAIDGLLGAPVTIFDSSDPANGKEQVQQRPWIPALTQSDVMLWELPTVGFG